MANWHIVDQRPDSQLLPSGRFQDYMAVTYEIDATGVQRTIKFGADTYTPDQVKAAIDADYATVAAIHSLSG